MPTFFFRWSDYTDFPWSEAYATNSEEINTFEVSQSENDFAQLTVTVKNPHIGLLNQTTAEGRKVWAWLSYQADDTAGTITPLFFGRLIGIPDDFDPESEAVSLIFQGRPSDYNTRKVNAALALMVAPYYDPVFVNPDKRLKLVTGGGGYYGDPDTVLQGYSKLWSIDRVTHEVTASDILEGEDSTEIFDADDIVTGIRIHLAQKPLTALTVIGKVSWTQTAGGSIHITDKVFTCYNAISIKNDWPKVGNGLSGGWNVAEGTYAYDNGAESAKVTQQGFKYENKDTAPDGQPAHRVGDVMSIDFNNAYFPDYGGTFYKLSESIQSGHRPGGWPDFANDALIGDWINQNIPLHYDASIMQVALPTVYCGLTLGYDAGVKRDETITIKLTANLQPIVTLPDPQDVEETITLNGSDVGITIDGATPIDNAQANNYFPSTRGQESIDYLMQVAIAHFKQRGRAVEITADIPFDRAINLTMRKNATINAPQLPGTTATGKVIRYAFGVDGGSGGNAPTITANLTIGCCIGYGDTVEEIAGTPVYVEDGYAEDGYQAYDGGTVSLGAVGYTPPIYTPGEDDLAFPLQRSQVIVSETVTAGTMQVQAGQKPNPFTGEAEPNVITFPTSIYTLELKPLDGASSSTYDLSATPVELPKQIDLEAASG